MVFPVTVNASVPVYQIGNSLRSYITNGTGAWLYQLYAMMGDASTVVNAYGIGGSGAGIVRYDTPETLRQAAEAGTIDLGVDSTALVQEFTPARDGHITRIETLGGKYLYGINVYTDHKASDIIAVADGVKFKITSSAGKSRATRPRSGISARRNTTSLSPCSPRPRSTASVRTHSTRRSRA